MVLNIFHHGRLPWEEEEEEEEGDKFDDDCCCTGSTPFGNHAKCQSLSEMEMLGGKTTATEIPSAKKKARRRREWQDKDADGAQHLLPR